MKRYFAFHRRFFNGHPRNVTLAVRRVIVRGVNHGLVVTATTDGLHSATSFHHTKPGKAVDLGVEPKLAGTPEARKREVAFQRFLLKRFGARAFLELFGPDNAANVKNGVQFTLPEGAPLENQHDNHVHVVPARVFALPKRPPKPKPVKPAAAKRVSARGVRFIARFEGFRAKAYKPVAAERLWTIGYGHTGRDVKEGQVISKARALVLLAQDVKRASDAVRAAFPGLNQNQYDALTSAVFNLGPGVLEHGRSLGEALRAPERGRPEKVRLALSLYVKGADGKVLPGLVTRRAAEAALFNSKTR